MSTDNHVDKIESTSVSEKNILINWIGQAGFIFKTNTGTIICIDPYLSNSAEKYDSTDPEWVFGRANRRMWFNGFKLENFHPDMVVCSHDHVDHTDPETLPLIYCFSEANFYGPKTVCNHMEKMNIDVKRINVLELNEKYNLDGVCLKPVYANHTEDSQGYILTVANIKIYITGDTCLDDRLYNLKEEEIDVMIACINGKFNNLSINEAIHLAEALDIKLLIPMHFDLMASNTVDGSKFLNACQENKLEAVILEAERDYFLSKETENVVLQKRK